MPSISTDRSSRTGARMTTPNSIPGCLPSRWVMVDNQPPNGDFASPKASLAAGKGMLTVQSIRMGSVIAASAVRA